MKILISSPKLIKKKLRSVQRKKQPALTFSPFLMHWKTHFGSNKIAHKTLSHHLKFSPNKKRIHFTTSLSHILGFQSTYIF